MKPRSVEEWFQLVPDLLSRKTWTLACARNQAQLFHKECPWGGRLGKIELEGIDLKPGAVVLRPELWPTYFQQRPEKGVWSELREVIAPGDAILRTSVEWMPCRLTDALFSKFENSIGLACFRGKELRFKVSRDFPQQGDSGLTVEEATGQSVQRLAWLRPETSEGKGRLLLAWRLLDDQFPALASDQFVQYVECMQRSYSRFFPHLCASEGMKLEKTCYVHLSMGHHLRSGNPLVPAEAGSTDATYVEVGNKLGLSHWERFAGRFRLADYLKSFLGRLGVEIRIFQSMDGQDLASHQCVVPRDQWQRIRGRFREAFRVQRSAYRRCNGGRNAPFFHEDGKPELSMAPSAPQQQAQPVLVIRNTFWHVPETCESMKRCRTVSLPLTHIPEV
mmetsp:Transcript_11483/g.27070  ORF Transcript_11483/g.27070 Transcript_11483/m.27070 type:complete len:391 (+) Transcript_11483:44-1216(+)